jgi:hypothetical protein
MAGFVPRNPGVPETSELSFAEKLNEMWWPSNLQPQIESVAGSPNIEK